MTDTELSGLELRRAVAERIGWRNCVTRNNNLRGTVPGHPDARAEVPPYEQSVDACLRELVPWARVAGFKDFDLSVRHINTWLARFGSMAGWLPFQATDTPAEAICRAFLKLPDAEC